MKFKFIIHKVILEAFNLFKVNLNLAMPILIFFLITVIVLSPLSQINDFVRLAIIALISVFTAGWLNMFHSCIKNSENQTDSIEQKVINSMSLYKEFFPGVGKNFQNILWGALILIVIFNIAELIFITQFGHFKNFALQDISIALTNHADIQTFVNSINPEDKAKLYKLAGYNIIFNAIVMYFLMFWTQFVAVEDKNPLKAFWESIKTVIKDPINTFILYIIPIIGFFAILVLNILLSVNFLGQLLAMMCFVYSMVYYVLMTFVYFEKYR